LEADTSSKILCSGHYSAVWWRCSKDFDLGRYVVSFHFYFTLVGSHMLVTWFQESSKTPFEITIPNNWAPENSLKIRKTIIPAKT